LNKVRENSNKYLGIKNRKICLFLNILKFQSLFRLIIQIIQATSAGPIRQLAFPSCELVDFEMVRRFFSREPPAWTIMPQVTHTISNQALWHRTSVSFEVQNTIFNNFVARRFLKKFVTSDFS